MSIEKVVSGGQTGVDRAALDAAMEQDVPVGGWCPSGRRAEDGRIPHEYPLDETPSDAYAQRTAWNVRDSDGTVLISRGALAGGTRLTKEEADRRGKAWLHVRPDDADAVQDLRRWVDTQSIRVLNVAGPRASEEEGIYDAAREILDRLFRRASRTDN